MFVHTNRQRIDQRREPYSELRRSQEEKCAG